MAKKNNNRSKKTAKGRRKPRNMALTVTEAKLKGPRFRSTDPVNTTAHEQAGSSAQRAQPAQAYGSVLRWSPWCLMLSQQALLAQGLILLIGAQRQFADNWMLLSRQATRAKAMPADAR
jgi:hypothetical protein